MGNQIIFNGTTYSDTVVNNTGVGEFTSNSGQKSTGSNNERFNDYAHNIADGDYSHAEGYNTTAGGNFSHAEGAYGKALTVFSHVEGYQTDYDLTTEQIVNGINDNTLSSTIPTGAAEIAVNSSGCEHVEGKENFANGQGAHVEGWDNVSIGDGTHTEGVLNKASGNYNHIEGQHNIIGEYDSTSDKYVLIKNNNGTYYNQTTACSTHVEGAYNKASGNYSHTEGHQNVNRSGGTHIEGYSNNVTNSSDYCHVEGISNVVTNGSGYNHLEGECNTSQNTATFNHIEGSFNIAQGGANRNHIEGSNNIVQNGTQNSHISGGYNTLTNLAKYTYVSGYGNITQGSYQTMIGKYGLNLAAGADNYVFVIGNGTSVATTRSNYIDNPEYKTYAVDDEVIYNGLVYKCIGATSGDWDSTKWESLGIEVIAGQEVTRSNALTVDWNGVLNVTGANADVQVNGVSVIGGGGDVANPNISDVYDDTTTYAVGDYCIYNNFLYKCTTAVTSAEAFDSAKWTQTTIAAELLSLASRIAALENMPNLNNAQF